MILRRFVLGFLLVCLTMIAAAHDLGLTTLDCFQVGNAVRLRVETPLSRLVVRDGLSLHPSGIQLDQSIRNQLYVWRNGVRIQPAESSITTDSQADMIRWEALVPGSLDDIGVSQRFYATDLKSIMMITLHRTGKPNQIIQLDATHQTWNQSLGVSGIASSIFEGIKLSLTRWQVVLLAIGLALVAIPRRTMGFMVIAFPVGIAVGAIIGLHLTAAWLYAALLAVAVANLVISASSHSKPGFPWIRIGLTFLSGLIIGSTEQNEPLIRIGSTVGYVVVLAISAGTMGLFAFRNRGLQSKVNSAASTFIGMVGVYMIVSHLLHN